MQNRKWQMADVQEYGLLKANAKENRNHLTEAESIFWEIAKGSGLGEKCRRQYIIGTYIVDFFFRGSRLIVELDGGYHSSIEQKEADSIRQRWLEKQGYTVLRFSNEEVLCNIDQTIETIKNKLNMTTNATTKSPFKGDLEGRLYILFL